MITLFNSVVNINLTCHAKDRKESKDRGDNKRDNMQHKTFFIIVFWVHFYHCLLNVLSWLLEIEFNRQHYICIKRNFESIGLHQFGVYTFTR